MSPSTVTTLCPLTVPPPCFATSAIRIASSDCTLAKSDAVYGWTSGKVATCTNDVPSLAVVRPFATVTFQSAGARKWTPWRATVCH